MFVMNNMYLSQEKEWISGGSGRFVLRSTLWKSAHLQQEVYPTNWRQEIYMRKTPHAGFKNNDVTEFSVQKQTSCEAIIYVLKIIKLKFNSLFLT